MAADAANNGQAGDAEAPAEAPVSYSASPSLVPWLKTNDVSVALTSYQSNLLYLLGRDPKGGLRVDQRQFSRTMGLAVGQDRLLLGTDTALVELTNGLAPKQRINDTFDACYQPRRIHITGPVDAHDIGLTDSGVPIFVATAYNCLAMLSDRHGFRELWRPPFISRLVREDRCHLNGLAMDDGMPAFVTAVSRSDTVDGWRDRRADGGVLIDVASGEVVVSGLSMPHSPRLYRGALYVLNSGTGELLRIDPAAGNHEVVAFCPGFVRGLAFHNGFAIVGLSRPRYERFVGLALDDKLEAADSTPWTGIQIIDLTSGAVVAWFRIDGKVAEVYDTAALPGVSCAMSMTPGTPEANALVTVEALGAAPEAGATEA